MKDHKPDFINNLSCRLINANKSGTGIVSNRIWITKKKAVIKD